MTTNSEPNAEDITPAAPTREEMWRVIATAHALLRAGLRREDILYGPEEAARQAVGELDALLERQEVPQW
jgi:hypothetical protein